MLPGVVLRAIVLSVVVCLTLGSTAPTRTDRLARQIGSMKLLFSGVAATVDPLSPVVPKNIPDAVRIVVTAGGNTLSPTDAEDFLGGPFEIKAELSGPGLSGAKTLASETSSFLLPLPALNVSGDYTLSNIRIVVDGKPVLDVTPQQVPVRVIAQVLITSVKTRALTLDELRDRGVVFDGDDVVGFEFTLAMTLESKPVNISFPVAFDRQGVAVPQPLSPLVGPKRTGVELDLPSFPAIFPLMLEPGDGVELPEIELPGGAKQEIRIPSVLVIPGDVGFLKQFFSAQLFVANGTPGGSGLVVRDVNATIQLPPGPDGVLGTADDPLALPELTTGIQEQTLPLAGVGPDGVPGTTDDTAALDPGEQGQAEFLVRGESEGFHRLDFDIAATLDGLVTGPIQVKGRASGGVLVRNPFLDITFTVPSVVRAEEPFKLYVNVRNIGDGLASRIDVSFNDLALSGLQIADGAEATQRIDTTLQKGDSATVIFDFVALRTGKVVATYLRFDSDAAADGTVNFTLGIGERGVPLSPDTLVLPAAVDALPTDLVNAAMRVLGQAWSIANAPAGTLPPSVTRIRKNIVIEKALAFAEGGLRIELGESPAGAVRGLLFDFYGGAPLDAGFDQLLRTTNAGTALTKALAAELAPAIADAGGLLAYERETARLAASGDDFLSFAVDAAGVEAPGATLFEQPNGVLGIVTEPTASPYELTLAPAAGGTTSVALTLPRGDGTFVRGTASFDFDLGATGRLIADLFRPESLTVEIDADGDGIFETAVPLTLETITPEGPRLVSATVIGPELLDGASSFGFHAAALFDRVVDEATASDVARYTLSDNAVRGAVAQLSGRLVFLTLEGPEGPYVTTTLDVEGIRDSRGVVGPPGNTVLQSRLAEEGAVLSGRVFEADGTPVSSGAVGYANYRGAADCSTGLEVLFAEVPLDASGRYEIHYVRRDPCGGSFRILFTDPATGELRSVSGFVRAGGERIVLDLALFGRGAVTGLVTENGEPAPGSTVVVTSGTDSQSGGITTTDGDGRYTVHDIVVGPVSVKAARGIAVGASSGRIARGGTTAAVDVLLDPGRARITGAVSKLEDGVTSLLPGAQVVYRIKNPGGIAFIAVAVTRTDAQGNYALEDLPHGNFELEAILDGNARFTLEAKTNPGDDIVRNIIIVIASEAELATLAGVVRLPNNDPVKGAEVRVGTRAVLTGVDGTFLLPGVPVKPGQTQLVQAIGPGRPNTIRSGRADFVVSESGQLIEGLVITLSGLGSAAFTVKDWNGDPLPNQLVGLIGNCGNLCGCASRTTNALGEVTFDDVSPGTHFAKAVFVGADFVDVALGSARVDSDGAIGHGLIQFAGTGEVTGTVLLPGGVDPAIGADVSLTAQIFDRNACELRTGASHSGRTDVNGRFTFTGVNLGRVSATASHPFADTRVGATSILTNDTDVDFTLELVDTTAGVLSGVVLLPDGNTPAGAGVELTAIGPLPEVTVRTDDAGNYAFAEIFPQGLYTITVADPVTGFVAREQLFLRVGEDVEHDFRLKGRGTVRVRVTDAAGVPVSNAFVKLTESDFPGSVFEAIIEPSESGVVTFTNVFEGPFSVEAQDVFGRDGGRVPSILPAPGVTIDLEVRLNAVGIVEGHFRLPSATAIPFGTVKLISGGRVIGQTTTAGAGDVGAFRFDFVPVGPIRLEAQDPLTARQGFVTGELAGQDQTLVLEIEARGLGRVEGKVTANGIDQDSAHIDLVSGTFRACTTADATGFYFLEGVPEGVVAVTASLGRGFLSGTHSDALIGDGNTLRLDVALRSSVTLTGTVTSAGTSDAAPPSLVTVRVGGVGGGTQSTTSDLVDGTFRFERVPAGLATIDVEVLGGIDKARRVVDLLPGETADVPIPLNGVGSLRVRALDANGVPTAGRLVIRGTGSFPYTFVIALSAGSEVVLPQVLAGPVTATLEAANLFGTASDNVRPGEELDLPVQVEDSGIVRGVALLGGTPAVGADVLVQLSGNRGIVTTQTNVDGMFEVRGVPLGAFDLRVVDPFTGAVGAMTGLELLANGEVIDGLVIDLDASPVRVTRVEPPDGSLDVPVDQVVSIHFSDAVASFANAVFVREGTRTIATTKSLSPDGLTLTLEGNWPDAQEMTVEVTTSLTDTLGRRALSTFTSRFHTVDLSPPEVVEIAPANLAIQVGVDTSITVVFNEPLGAATDIGSLVALNGPAGVVAGTAELVSPSTVRFTPSAPLVDNIRYTLSVNGAVDALGNQQTTAFTSSFATPDTAPPSVVLTTPQPGGWTTQATPNINFTVNDNLSGMDPATIALTLDGQAVAPSFVGISSFSFAPPSDLAQGLHEVLAAVADRGGNLGSLSASFRVDSIPPAPAQIAGITDGQTVQGQVALSAVSSDDTSGVARIDVRRDGGTLILSLFPPAFEGALSTNFLSEGDHVLFARAVDVAGNSGPDGTPVSVFVDNQVLSVNITAPAARSPPLHFRDEVLVKATPSEAADRLEFSVGSVTLSDDTAPYEVTLPLDAAPEGTVPITVTGFGVAGDVAAAIREIVVDRTPPLPPDAAVIRAEPPGNGVSLVFGRAGAVEPNAIVDATNTAGTANGATASATAESDGSFAMSLAAAVDDVLSLTATDELGNVSDPTTIVVRRTPSLPPSEGSTSLRFEGVLVDRVGPELTPDGNLDAVFTISLSIGEDVTRELEFIDLEGPAPNGLKSTRPSVGAVLGVAVDAGAPLLNDPDGRVGFPVTTGTTLTLFAADERFIQEGETYTVTAAFTDGSRFVGRLTLTPGADGAQVPHSASIEATPSTLVTDGLTPATTTLLLTDIRDIEGGLVPDGAKVAIAVADMASTDPRQNPFRSAGGTIEGGEAAANHSDFRVFTISGGEVVATYSTEPIGPTPVSGAQVLVQVLASDAGDNVLGTQAIATLELHVRHLSDQAIVSVMPAELYADKSDRRIAISVDVRDASGSPMPDGTKVLLSARSCAGRINGVCVGSKGGAIVGGEASPSGSHYRAFTVEGGLVSAAYSSSGIFAGVGDVATANIQVVPANDSGRLTSSEALGVAPIALVGASGAEVQLSPSSVPVVFPIRPVSIRLRHVHNARGNLVPDDAKLLVSSSRCATRVSGACVASAGGTILDGETSPTGVGLKAFSLSLGEVVATYAADNVNIAAAGVKTAGIQIAMADPAGVRLDTEAVAVANLSLVAATNAVGSAEPPSLLADGGLHVATVTFSPVLDAFGNVVPDGSKVVASANSCASRINGVCVPSVGGQILGGESSPSGTHYKVLTVEGGAVTLQYANQNVIAAPGQIKRANIQLLAGASNDRFLDSGAIGVVPVELVGLTSAESFVSPASVIADGGDRRATITLSAFRDAFGQPVPDGTRVALSARSCAGRINGVCVSSAGGQVVGGETFATLSAHYHVFTITNDQVVAEYSADGKSVTSGSQTAVVQVLFMRSDDRLVSSSVVATVPIQLLSPPSTVVTTSPMDLLGDASERLSQVTVSQISEPGGTPVAEGAKVGLSAADCAAVDFDGTCLASVGGEIRSAGTSPGDGDPATNDPDYRIFTVAGGQVRAAYAATGPTSIAAGVGETLEARIAVVLADATGNISSDSLLGSGTVHLHGMSSATAAGPTALALGETGSVLFSGIKDSAGNTVPDGAKVVVSAVDCATFDDTDACVTSAGGTVLDGEVSPSGGAYKVFTVIGGSVTVTYSTDGAAIGEARIQIAPARPDGTPIGNQSLIGGVWTVAITN